MKRSLRLRLLLAAVALVGFGLTLTDLGLERVFRDFLAARYQADMERVVDTLAAGIELQPQGFRVTRQPADPRFELPGGARYWQVSGPDGEPVRSRSLWDSAITAEAVHAGDMGFSEMDGPDGDPVAIISRTLNLDGGAAGSRDLVIYAGFGLGEMADSLADFSGEIRRMLVITGTLLLLASLLQVWVGLRPLAGLRQAVAAVRSGNASRLDTSMPSELGPLVDEINDLLADQESAIGRARARAADLAHGIKTPLTIITQHAEGLADSEAAAEILDQVDTIRKRTDRALSQARLGVGQMGDTNLFVLAEKMLRVMSGLHGARKIEWRLEVAPDIELRADPADIAEVIGNLLDNARKWARSRVTLAASFNQGHVRLSITDDGPGIASGDRVAALERGRRTVRPGSETGLGLSIAAEIVRAHGGTIRLSDAPGGGLMVEMDWPRSGPGRRPPQQGPA